jgi:hypothetical protein
MDEDEGYARRALRLLDEEPASPSLVDIPRAVAEGRRRVRRRTLLRTGSAAVVVGLVAGGLAGTVAHRQARAPGLSAVPPGGAAAASVAAQAPEPPTGCAAEVLPAPGKHHGIVVIGGDPTGRYLVGRSFSPDGRYHPLLWTDGKLLELDRTGTDQEVDGIAVNSAGTVAWSSDHVYRYRDGKVEPVAAADGYRVMTLDAAGDLYALRQEPIAVTAPHPALRLLTVPAHGAPTVRDLQAEDPHGRGFVLAVGQDGTAVGNAAVGTGPLTTGASHAAAWRSGGGLTMLTPPDPADAARPTAAAGNWVGGAAWSTTGPPDTADLLNATGVRWNLATGAAEAVSGIADVLGINRYGWLVGEDAHARPVAVLGDHLLPLPSPAGTDGIGTLVYTVSDDGRVIGGQASRADSVVAVWWTCN